VINPVPTMLFRHLSQPPRHAHQIPKGLSCVCHIQEKP
jgi:hypothetical protein